MAKVPKLKLKSWYSNKYQVILFQRNVLFFISFFAVCSVLIAVIFVRQMMASKSLVPYVIELEEKSGVPTVVEQLNQSSFTADETLKRHFIFLFIKAAEGYNYGTFRDDYNRLRLFSTPVVWRQLLTRINPTSKDSPYVKIANRGVVEINLKSMSFPSPNRATVRFRLRTLGSTPGFTNNIDKIADVEFVFSSNINLSITDRYINPLGFQVTKYVVDNELTIGSEENR